MGASTQADRYTPRVIDDELDELLPVLPALAIEGPKGVGKTATAERRAATVLRLDDPAERALVQADPRRVLTGRPTVLLDEWQREPQLWDLVRRAVDDGAAAGHFLLTGSAVPRELPVHSGAGRIPALRMRPLTLSERLGEPATVSLTALLSGGRSPVTGSTAVRLDDYAREIVRSGFPGLRRFSGRGLRLQLDGYLDRVVQRDFEEIGHRVRAPATLRRWLTAYAAATAGVASYETIRDAATSGEGQAPARTTTGPYRDALEQLFIIDPVPAWAPTRNPLARLLQAPKHHLADPALAARLLGVDEGSLLRPDARGPLRPREGPLAGALFESLVTQSVRVYAQRSEARVGHLRTRGGEQEIDLIVERGDGRVLAMEVKLATVPAEHDLRGLRWLAGRIGDDLLDAVVVTTGGEAFRRTDGIAVVPAALLGP
ncbi:MAG: ATP-binding protein [Thermoleophilia bacterium]